MILPSLTSSAHSSESPCASLRASATPSGTVVFRDLESFLAYETFDFTVPAGMIGLLNPSFIGLSVYRNIYQLAYQYIYEER